MGGDWREKKKKGGQSKVGSKKKRLRRVLELKRRLNQINIELREWKRGGVGEGGGGKEEGGGGVGSGRRVIRESLSHKHIFRVTTQ